MKLVDLFRETPPTNGVYTPKTLLMEEIPQHHKENLLYPFNSLFTPVFVFKEYAKYYAKDYYSLVKRSELAKYMENAGYRPTTTRRRHRGHLIYVMKRPSNPGLPSTNYDMPHAPIEVGIFLEFREDQDFSLITRYVKHVRRIIPKEHEEF